MHSDCWVSDGKGPVRRDGQQELAAYVPVLAGPVRPRRLLQGQRLGYRHRERPVGDQLRRLPERLVRPASWPPLTRTPYCGAE